METETFCPDSPTWLFPPALSAEAELFRAGRAPEQRELWVPPAHCLWMESPLSGAAQTVGSAGSRASKPTHSHL